MPVTLSLPAAILTRLTRDPRADRPHEHSTRAAALGLARRLSLVKLRASRPALSPQRKTAGRRSPLPHQRPRQRGASAAEKGLGFRGTRQHRPIEAEPPTASQRHREDHEAVERAVGQGGRRATPTQGGANVTLLVDEATGDVTGMRVARPASGQRVGRAARPRSARGERRAPRKIAVRSHGDPLPT